MKTDETPEVQAPAAIDVHVFAAWCRVNKVADQTAKRLIEQDDSLAIRDVLRHFLFNLLSVKEDLEKSYPYSLLSGVLTDDERPSEESTAAPGSSTGGAR